MENNDTNTDYHKFVRLGDQIWEIVEITIGIIFFFAQDIYALFFIQGVFKSHLKCAHINSVLSPDDRQTTEKVTNRGECPT